MQPFKHIGITGRLERTQGVETLTHLIDFLQQQALSILLDEAMAGTITGSSSLSTCHRQAMGAQCDLVVVVGGDGSLLGAARDLVDHNVPVIGVNRGRLGFLTDICPSELATQLAEVLNGRYRVESRFLLAAQIERQGKPVGHGDALNDVVLHPGQSTHTIAFELFVDDQFVYQQRSDGLIIATPTGSTAYALSGGGPIMHPTLDAVVLVPMFPHTLTSRPLVVNGNSTLKLVIHPENDLDPKLSCDGQIHRTLSPGDQITVQKKQQRLQLLHPLSHDFYESCRSKLRWNYPGQQR